jgi:hypothetical protein
MLKAHPCGMVRWGEIAALLGGITSVQGTPNRTCNKGLVRNIENQHDLELPANHIRTYILDISSFKSTIDFTKTKSFVVHIAEGIVEKLLRLCGLSLDLPAQYLYFRSGPAPQTIQFMRQGSLIVAGTARLLGFETLQGLDQFVTQQRCTKCRRYTEGLRFFNLRAPHRHSPTQPGADAPSANPVGACE